MIWLYFATNGCFMQLIKTLVQLDSWGCGVRMQP